MIWELLIIGLMLLGLLVFLWIARKQIKQLGLENKK